MNCRFYIAVAAFGLSSAGHAQDVGAPVVVPAAVVAPAPTPPDSAPSQLPGPVAYVPELPRIPAPPRTIISCERLPNVETVLSDAYASGASDQRLDRTLLNTALVSYRQHNCTASTYGPSAIVVVDFAKKSSEPRLWLVDLITGKGIDDPVLVTHGAGSDPDDDGMVNWFANIKDSLTSSIGAVRGAEVYSGKNGRSLRLDGLDPTNSEIRRRDIVVHSVNAKKRTYFRANYIAERNGVVGMSEGCFVVVPERRDWLIDSLSNGGFLYAGASGERGAAMIAAALPRPPTPVVVPVNPPAVVVDANVPAPQAGGAPAIAPPEPAVPVTNQ